MVVLVRPSWWCAMVATMVLLSPVAVVSTSNRTNRPPLVGNGGYAPYFDWNTHSDALTLHWTDAPTTAFSIEFWYMVTDPYLYGTTLLSYGVYNAEGRHSAGSGVYEQANEISLWGNNDFIRFGRGTEQFDCQVVDVPACNLYANVGSWTHFAATWTNHGGEDGGDGAVTLIYIDGKMVHNHTHAPGADGAHSLEPGGVIMLTQEQDSPFGDLEEDQSMTGFIDEFRVWSTVRTQDEIEANYKRSIDMENDPDAADLNLYWRFDTQGGVADGEYMVEADLSSSGTSDGLIGALPTIKNVMQYGTNRGVVVPDAPEYMPSGAPVVGGGKVVVPCACSSGSGSVTIELKAEDPDGDSVAITIASLPISGSIATTAGTALSVGDTVTEGSVVYTQLATFTTSDSFAYSASDGTHSATATVTIVNNDVAAAANMTIIVDEDELKPVILGKSSNTNEYLEVVITALPAKGTLYQVAFEAERDPFYETLITDSSDVNLVAITASGTILTNARGVVLYVSEVNEFQSSGYASFGYKYVDPTTAYESDEATVTLDVVPVNDGPEGDAVAVQVADGNTSVVVTLTGSDVDNDASTPAAYDPMFAPHFFATIKDFPALGTLHQASTDGEALAEISAVANPSVTSYVSKILRYSSQYSACGIDCFSWASDQCPASNTGAVDSTMLPAVVDQVWGEETCSLTKYAAVAFLGEPDFYPGYADTVLGWDLSEENYGKEWIEVMYDTPLYISTLQVYETYKPGSIYKVSSAESYEDDNTAHCNENNAGGTGQSTCSTDTEWTTLYSGTAAPAGEAARIFEPNLCPYAYKTQFVRLDLDTAAVPGWNNFDAAMISGSQEAPAGLVMPQAALETPNRVIYTPLPGIHGDGIDSFTFTLSDCVDKGAKTTAALSVAEPAAGSTSDTAFDTTSVHVDPSANATVTVDFTNGFDYDSVDTRWPFGTTDNLIWTVNAIDSTVNGATDGVPLVVGASGALNGTTSIDVTVFGDAELGGKISIWMTTAASPVTVRYILEVIIDVGATACPDGTAYIVDGCVQCAVNEYSVGGAPCTPCPEPSLSLPGSSKCELCSLGFTWDSSASPDGACRECPDGAVCPGGDSAPIPEAGYWAGYGSVGRAHLVYPCRAGACKGGEGDRSCWASTNFSTCHVDDLQCSKGATGLFCGACLEDRRYNNLKQTCELCDAVSQSQASFTVIALGILIVIAAAISIVMCLQDCKALVQKLRAQSKRVGSWVFFNLVGAQHDMGTVKVLWASYQIMSSTPGVLEIDMPYPFSAFLNTIGKFTQLDLVSAFGGACINPIFQTYSTRTMITCLTPVVLLLIEQLYYRLRQLGVKQEGMRRKLYSFHMNLYLLVTYCILPEMTKVLFRSLPVACVEIAFDDGGERRPPLVTSAGEPYIKSKDGNIKYLKADVSTDCNAPSFHTFTVFNIVMIALCVAVMLSYVILILTHRDNIRKIDDESLELRHAIRYDHTLKPFLFLIRPYKRDMYLFDVYDMVRRIVFVSILPSLPLESKSARAVLGCVLALLALMISSNMKPYHKEVTNVLSEALLYMIMLTFLLAHVLELEDVDVLGGNRNDEMSTVGVAALLSQLIVIVIGFRPGIKALYEYREEERRLQAAIEHVTEEQEEALLRASSTPRALERASLVNVHMSPALVTPLALRLTASGSWLKASKGGAEDTWLRAALMEALEGMPAEESESLLHPSRTHQSLSRQDAQQSDFRGGLAINFIMNGETELMELNNVIEQLWDMRALEFVPDESKRSSVENDDLVSMMREADRRSDRREKSQRRKKKRSAEEKKSNRDPRSLNDVEEAPEEAEEAQEKGKGSGSKSKSKQKSKKGEDHVSSTSELAFPDDFELQEERRKLRAAAEGVQTVLGHAITDFAGEADLVKTCDTIIDRTQNILSSLYTTIWGLVSFTEHEGYESYEVEVAGLKHISGSFANIRRYHVQKARAKNIVNLVDDAIAAKLRVDPLMKRIDKTVMGCKAIVPASIKPLERVIEKAMMDPECVLTRVVDVVRYRFVGSSMERVARVLAEFHKSSDLKVLDVVDNFKRADGPEKWRSCLIYFSLADDKNGHICEAEVVHARFAEVRYGPSYDAKDAAVLEPPSDSTGQGERSGRSGIRPSARQMITRMSFGHHARHDNGSCEHLHIQLRSAREILKRLRMLTQDRVANLTDQLTDSDRSQLLSNYVKMGIKEEDLLEAGVDPAALGPLCRGVSGLATPARQMSRLQSMHQEAARSDDAQQSASPNGVGSKASSKVAPLQDMETDEIEVPPTVSKPLNLVSKPLNLVNLGQGASGALKLPPLT